jgi:hypothetical protein
LSGFLGRVRLAGVTGRYTYDYNMRHYETRLSLHYNGLGFAIHRYIDHSTPDGSIDGEILNDSLPNALHEAG